MKNSKGGRMKSRFILTTAFSVLPLGSLCHGGSWETYRDEFMQNPIRHDDDAVQALLQIGRSGEKEAIRFLEEIYESEPDSVNRYAEDYPKLEIRKSNHLPGIAEVALIQLGDEELKSKLISESLHGDKPVRLNAFRKAKKLQGDLAIEVLSFFIGDVETGGIVLESLERLAALELTQIMEDPPYPVYIDDLQSLKGLDSGGREKWRAWRYENYGPIPGREAMFARFENSGDPLGDGDKGPEPEEAPTTGSKDAAAPSPAEPDPRPLERDSNPWPWLGGLFALVVAGGLAVVFIRHGRR